MNMKELAQQLQVKRGELGKMFTDNTTAAGLKLSTAQIAEVNQRETELKDLTEKYAEAKRLAEIADTNTKALQDLQQPVNPLPFDGKGASPSERFREAKSLGQQYVESAAYKGKDARAVKEIALPFDMKTAMTASGVSGAGYPPQVLRSGVFVGSPQPQPTLIDLLPITETTQNGYKYMLETLYTNAAAPTAEGALAAEAALNVQEQLSPIVKIPVYIPITEEELADQEGIRDYVDSRLTLMIKQALNQQVVSGNGASPNLTGIVNVAGVQAQAVGGDVTPDAIYKAMIKIMTVGIADPSGVWFNPLNWQTVRLMKTTTGQYLYGDPFSPGPNTIFGLPVAMHVNVPQGTGIVADFATYTKLVYRMGIEIEVSNSHLDYFARAQLAIRALMRVGFVVYRPQAVCLVTGLS